MNQTMKLIWGKEEREHNTKNWSPVGEHLGLDSMPGKSRELMHSLQWQVDKGLKNLLVTSSNNSKKTCYLKKQLTCNPHRQNLLNRPLY